MIQTNEQSFNSNELSTANNNLNAKSKKKFHYFLSQPTCAPNIGLCIGHFECTVDPNINEISYFSNAELVELVKNTTNFLNDVYEFYEDLFSVQFPHSSYKIVFCYDVYEECIHYSGLTIVNVALLTSKQIIDQTLITRRLLAYSMAKQFFGCFVCMFDWHSWWLIQGIAWFAANLFLKKMLGNNEYKYIIYQEMKEICTYEREQGYILLDLNFSELTGKVSVLIKNIKNS
jgi:transcription initiation factor TFIID subunit 2